MFKTFKNLILISTDQGLRPTNKVVVVILRNQKH